MMLYKSINGCNKPLHFLRSDLRFDLYGLGNRVFDCLPECPLCEHFVTTNASATAVFRKYASSLFYGCCFSHVAGSVEEFLAHALRVARWVDEWVGFGMIATLAFHSLRSRVA